MKYAAREIRGLTVRDSLTIAAIVLTSNEERHLARLCRCLEKLSCCVFVVDSFSSDKTVMVAKSFGAQVVQRRFTNYAQQFQWALDNLPFDADWVMRLDADETLTPELIDELKMRLPSLPNDVTGVNLNRRHIVMDRWIRHGGRYPLKLLRVWRRGDAKIEQRWMDEHMVLLRGRAITFEHDFCDHNLNDLAFFTDKHNKYAMREAVDRLNDQFQLFERDEGIAKGEICDQARLKRLFKEAIYNHLPFGVGPFLYFIWRYVFLLGFLDGREGIIYHFLQGFWYRFLVEARVLELRRSLTHLDSKEAMKAELRRLTGLSIE